MSTFFPSWSRNTATKLRYSDWMQPCYIGLHNKVHECTTISWIGYLQNRAVALFLKYGNIIWSANLNSKLNLRWVIKAIPPFLFDQRVNSVDRWAESKAINSRYLTTRDHLIIRCCKKGRRRRRKGEERVFHYVCCMGKTACCRPA